MSLGSVLRDPSLPAVLTLDVGAGSARRDRLVAVVTDEMPAQPYDQGLPPERPLLSVGERPSR